MQLSLRATQATATCFASKMLLTFVAVLMAQQGRCMLCLGHVVCLYGFCTRS